MQLNESIKLFLDEQQHSLNFFQKNTIEINQICKRLVIARNKGKKIFAMGNGGSGSTASHFISDLLKTAIIKNEKRFKAMSLVDNIPVILAWSNDKSYDDIFIEQLKNHFSKGDILIGFSGSGNFKKYSQSLEIWKR